MSTTTSGTPRTDEARYCDEQMAFIVDAAFAQQLERELTHAHAQLHALRLVCGTTDANKFQTVVDRQLAELEELRKDKARLDYIDAQKEPKSFYASRQAIDLDMEAS